MKKGLISLLILFAFSCIPLKNGQNRPGYDIVVAKEFKKDLPERYAFVFKDKKNTNAFYRFINWKLGRLDVKLEENLPFKLGDEQYFLSFYERPRESASLNLLPTQTVVGEGAYAWNVEYWYILITVVDSQSMDCLKPTYVNRDKILLALEQVKDEYEKSPFKGDANLDQ